MSEKEYPHADTCDLTKFDFPIQGYECTCHVAALAEKDREIQRLRDQASEIVDDLMHVAHQKLQAENERLTAQVAEKGREIQHKSQEVLHELLAKEQLIDDKRKTGADNERLRQALRRALPLVSGNGIVHPQITDERNAVYELIAEVLK